MSKVFLILSLMYFSLPTDAVEISEQGGGSGVLQAHDQVSEFTQMNRWDRYTRDREKLIHQGKLNRKKSSGAHAMFAFPLKNSLDNLGYYGTSNFVDQNASFPDQLADYNGGMRTYDLIDGYNHQGIDYFTWPHAWYKMDQDQVHVVAAEAGVITTKLDGNYDRSCSFDDPNDEGWNAVYITHADGSYAWYGHLKNGSLTTKSVGESVDVGEYLGVVGSSGTSTGPHLHFETYDATDNLIEPHFGAFNILNDDSWWRDQKPYYESRLNELMTHAEEPQFLTCADVDEESPNEAQFFDHGDEVYLAAYYRDQLSTQTTNYEVVNSNGVVALSWNHASDLNHYAASFWWWRINLPTSGGEGRWAFRATYEAEIVEQYFWLGDSIFSDSFE